MSTDTAFFLNFGIHSLMISALGWLIVRFMIRDALRRSMVANVVLLFSLIGPFSIAYWPYPYRSTQAPVLTAIHQTLETDWRIVVAAPEAPAAVAEPAKASVFTVDHGVRGLRWLFWTGVVLLMLRHLWQTWTVLRWCWRLRDITQAEADALPKDIRFERLSVFEHEGTPCVAGWLMPVIAVPASAFQTLRPQQWRWLMRHEEEHLRAHDTASTWLHGCLRAWLWWNPFAHALVEEFARAREEVCDAAALDDEREPTAYADFLLDWAARPQLDAVGVMPIASSLPAQRLKARLVALMDGRSVRKKVGWLFSLACLAGVFLGPMLVASVGFAIAATSVAAEQPKPSAPAVDDGKLFTRAFRVPLNFVGDGVTAREFLTAKGIVFPEGASTVFNKATSQLIVRNTTTELDKVEKLVEAAVIRRTQVLMTSKFIQAERLFAIHGEILSRQEAEDLVRSVSQTKGIHLMSGPSVLSLPDQQAQVQVVQTNPADARQFVGVQLDMVTTPLPNGKATLRAKADLSAEEDATTPFPPETPDKIDWKKVRLHTIAGSSDLATGEALVLHLTTPTRPVTVLVSITALKPDGTEAPSFADIRNVDLASEATAKDAVHRDALPKREAKLVRDAGTAATKAGQKIRLSVKVAEVSASVGKILGDWDPGAMTWQADASAKPVPISEAPPEVRHQFTASGILTGEQFSSVIRALAQKTEAVKIITLADGTTTSGKGMDFGKLDSFDGRPLKITATAEADGHTLKMEAKLPDLVPDQKRLVVTAITLWSGQTLMLSGMPSYKPGQTRVLFITGTLLDEEGRPVIQ